MTLAEADALVANPGFNAMADQVQAEVDHIMQHTVASMEAHRRGDREEGLNQTRLAVLAIGRLDPAMLPNCLAVLAGNAAQTAGHLVHEHGCEHADA